jgi:hypothetical protein
MAMALVVRVIVREQARVDLSIRTVTVFAIITPTTARAEMLPSRDQLFSLSHIIKVASCFALATLVAFRTL